MPYSEKQKYKPSNVNYTSKDFSTIKSDLIEYTKAYFPDTYKDFNETSSVICSNTNRFKFIPKSG